MTPPPHPRTLAEVAEDRRIAGDMPMRLNIGMLLNFDGKRVSIRSGRLAAISSPSE